MAILDDPDRTFIASDFVRLEVLPKAIYERRHDERAFYEAFFDAAGKHVRLTSELCQLAFEEAGKNGLSAIDALHVAAATTAQADELVTTERRPKPIHRTTSIKVRTITEIDSARIERT